MQIKDLKPKQGNVDIVIDVVDVGAVREFQKFGKPGRVATALAKDESGDIKLTLWNEDIDKVNAGDKVHLVNGYVNEWQGEMQLTTGRMGKFEIIGKVDISPAKEQDSKAMADAKSEEEHSKPNADVEEDIEDLNNDEI